MSGVSVNPQCLEEYQALKLGKKIKYIVFTVSDDRTEIVVEQKGSDPSYEEFISKLPEKSPRWAVYDFEYEKGDEGKRNKILFISWCV